MWSSLVYKMSIVIMPRSNGSLAFVEWFTLNPCVRYYITLCPEVATYTVMTFDSFSKACFLLIASNRFYILGLRRPLALTSAGLKTMVENIMDQIETTTMPIRKWLQFSGLPHELDWSRLHGHPTLDELNSMRRCGCCVNPMKVCAVHKCCCGCQKHGAKSDGCKWRASHNKFLAEKVTNFDLGSQVGRLTYIELLELQGKPGPSSPRERNVLNILSYLSQPLQMSQAVLDRSQTISRNGFRTDGALPTVCKNSQLWSMALGRDIPPHTMAAFFGHVDSDFSGMDAATVTRLLGNSMHLADAGVIMSCGILIKAGLLS